MIVAHTSRGGQGFTLLIQRPHSSELQPAVPYRLYLSVRKFQKWPLKLMDARFGRRAVKRSLASGWPMFISRCLFLSSSFPSAHVSGEHVAQAILGDVEQPETSILEMFATRFLAKQRRAVQPAQNKCRTKRLAEVVAQIQDRVTVASLRPSPLATMHTLRQYTQSPAEHRTMPTMRPQPKKPMKVGMRATRGQESIMHLGHAVNDCAVAWLASAPAEEAVGPCGVPPERIGLIRAAVSTVTFIRFAGHFR
ncbi:hypothetical protein LX36DRAFT_96844 [Colletotrichum falcatum]|nr:hypothetical protein LX36DRAFT_96844 [Colletotrichum falcatum]